MRREPGDACPRVLAMKSAPVRPDRHVGRAMALDQVDGAGMRSALPMKIALVSPYDTAHPGGVSEHIAHLRTEFLRHGHDVTVLAPRGRKGGLEVRDGFYGIGRTVPIPANGSMVRVTFDVTLYTAVKALLRQRAIRRRPSARAADSGPAVSGPAQFAIGQRGDVSRVPGLQSLVHRLQAVHDLHDVAPRRPHRRLRAGAGLRQPVLSGSVRHHSERDRRRPVR